MEENEIIRAKLREAGNFYIKELKSELEFQQHIASGKLAKGFFTRIHYVRGKLVLDVMNNTSYLRVVNEGDKNGVSVDFNAILNWAKSKGLDFKKGQIKKIVAMLSSKYLTEGGEKVAPRRYFFIEVAFDAVLRMGVRSEIERSILKQVESNLEKTGKSKEVRITVG